MLNVIAGFDPKDSTSSRVPVPDYLADLEKGVKGLRIGLSPDYFRVLFPDAQTKEYAQKPLPAEIEQVV